MKKSLSIVTATITLISLLSGCDKDEIRADGKTISRYAVSVEQATANYEDDLQKCKSKKYDNLDWTNVCELQMPVLTECYDIQATAYYSKPSNKEAISAFVAQCEQHFGAEYKSDKIYFRANRDYAQSTETGNGMTYNAGVKLADFRAELENDDSILIYDFCYIDLENLNYLWGFTDSNPLWLCKGEAIRFLDYKYRPTSLLPSDLTDDYSYETFANNSDNLNKKYNLANGEYSFAEAVSFIENEFYPSDIDNLSCKVTTITPIQIKDDVYFYNMSFVPTWNNIPFDSNGEFEASDSNSANFFRYNAQALIVNKNEVDIAHRFSPLDIENFGEPIDRMLTLEKAADFASESLTKGVMFEVRSAELVYSGAKDNETNIASLCPTWRFILYNENDEKFYNVYIDAVSGECSHYSYSPL